MYIARRNTYIEAEPLPLRAQTLPPHSCSEYVRTPQVHQDRTILTVAEETLAVTPPAEVLTEAAAIGTAATNIGTGLHTIIEGLRTQNEALHKRLQLQQQEHGRRMAAECRHLERLDRETD